MYISEQTNVKQILEGLDGGGGGRAGGGEWNSGILSKNLAHYSLSLKFFAYS